MATVTMSRNYPVERSDAFVYLTNPTVWPDYYSGVIEIRDADSTSFEKAGDAVSFTYSLLGRRVSGRTTIDEIREGEMVRHTTEVSGLPDVHQTWQYRDADSGFTLEVTMTTEESTNLLGRTIDRLVVPRALQRDVERTLDTLDGIFSLGVPNA